MDIPEIKALDESEPENSSDQKGRRRESGVVTDAAPGLFSFKKNQEYYTSSGRKASDFFLGLFIPLLFIFLFYAPMFLGMRMMPFRYLSSLVQLLFFPAYILAVIFSFLKGRKWLGIGLLSTLLLCFLFAGLIILFLYMAFR